MSRLAWATLLGACATTAAVALGSRPLGVAGVGILLAALVGRAWAGAVRGPATLTVSITPQPASEGDRIRIEIEARRSSRVPVGGATVRGRLGGSRAIECPLAGHGRTLVGIEDLGRLPRGRYPLEETRLELVDHLGLSTQTVAVPVRAAILVRPRLVELRALPGDVGRRELDGRRLLLRRPVGFDLHSVREYEQGESLRRVHWPTTARRGRLMVKDLQDAPRDAVVVLLDCDPAGAVGEPPHSSFDTAVRAAGSLVRAIALRGRRAVLVTTASDARALTVRGLGGDFSAALDVLAAVRPDARAGLAAALRRGETAASEAAELVVVTAVLSGATVDAILRSARRSSVSVVWIDAASFAGRPATTSPGALRLARGGITTAVVRAGDDLAAALAPGPVREAARA
ncbi:MAG: hypothetical protein KatS3mg012_1256 [Gaiellaceae bacterium]|nr:MAG: hypothetical protein KatS3mg012_1256 [Gaiellaceae bacterium]